MTAVGLLRQRLAARPPIPPNDDQRRYLERGLAEPGGKLPLRDREGRETDRKTVESCMERGWTEPWFANPLKPAWLVCRLTPAGHAVLGRTSTPPAGPEGAIGDGPGGR